MNTPDITNILANINISVALLFIILSTVASKTMDMAELFQKFAWCKSEWSLPNVTKDINELLKHCMEMPQVKPCDDVDEVIAKSNGFLIKFPIQTIRLQTLKTRRPIERLKNNIVSTYPLLHERALLLMAHFLIYKREYGSSMERELYENFSVPEFIDRLLTKRAISFVGAKDKYVLLSGKKGVGGWESIGTDAEQPPLVLADCLSYDELKISAMLFVSGPTECINDGERKNKGVVNEEDIEPNVIIIGSIGTRLKRSNRMEFEDIMITKKQNCTANGYGEDGSSSKKLKTTQVSNDEAKRMWRQMWAEFYQIPNITFEEIQSKVPQDKTPEQRYSQRYVKLSRDNIFNNEVFYKRVSILAETVLLETEARASEVGKDAYLNVIGCGLGVWCVSKHQPDVYVVAFLERVNHLLQNDKLQHVSDINFSYIAVTPAILEMFKSEGDSGKDNIFFKNEEHPKGGISIHNVKREPASCLTGPHKGKLLVLTYAWDSNAHPGNEFWYGKLAGSGDSAAACCTQVSELHNAYINPAVAAVNARIAAPNDALRTLKDYSINLPL